MARLAQAGRAQCDSCCCCHDWQHPMLGVINWPHNYFSFVEKIFGRLKTWEADTDGTFVFSLLVASGGKNMSCGRPMIRLWIIYSIFARIHPLEQLRSQFKAVGLIENEMVRLKGPSARLQFLRCSLARLVAGFRITRLRCGRPPRFLLLTTDIIFTRKPYSPYSPLTALRSTSLSRHYGNVFMKSLMYQVSHCIVMVNLDTFNI